MSRSRRNTLDEGRKFIRRCKDDYDLRTIAAAAASLGATAAFALYNGALGLRHSSLWHGAISAYYLLLAALRGTIIGLERYESRRGRRTGMGFRGTFALSALLLVLNLSLIVPIALMVKLQKPVRMTLIPAISMAAYTTVKITMASIHLRRRRRSSDRLVRLLRTISFIDALVSILTLQNTLIMVKSGGNELQMLPLTAATSAVIWLAALGLSIRAVVEEVRERSQERPCRG